MNHKLATVTAVPTSLRVGPDQGGVTTIEIALDDGRLVTVPLDAAHAKAVSDRLRACVDGSIADRAPSRRVLDLDLTDERAA